MKAPYLQRQWRIVRTTSLLIGFSAPAWIMLLFSTGEYPIGIGLLVVPVMVAASFLLARRLSGQDPFERNVIVVGLVEKLAAAAFYSGMVFYYYPGGDCITYFDQGSNFANSLSMIGTDAILHPFYSTNFVTMLAGLVAYLIPSYVTVSCLFALLSFWGQYLIYRAFTIAVPEADRRDMAMLIFLLPSIAFWPATVGKEATILFAIGLCVYGYARATVRANPVGYVICGVGLVLAMAVRPHMGAMLGLALTASMTLSSTRHGIWGLLNRGVGIPLTVVGTIFLVSKAQAFLGASDFQTGMGVLSVVQRNSAIGGSAFGGSEGPVSRVLTAPFLLFRPFPWESLSLQVFAASLEGMALAFIFWRRRLSVWYAVKNWRNPIIAFTLVYAMQYMVIFSVATGNFGIMVRQRVMLLPLAVMLVCLPPAQPGMFAGRRTHWKVRWRRTPSYPIGQIPPAISRSSASHTPRPEAVPDPVNSKMNTSRITMAEGQNHAGAS